MTPCPHCNAPLDGAYDAGTRTLHAPWSCRERLRERVVELEAAVHDMRWFAVRIRAETNPALARLLERASDIVAARAVGGPRP